MANGIPVLTSDRSSLPRSFGGCAYWSTRSTGRPSPPAWSAWPATATCSRRLVEGGRRAPPASPGGPPPPPPGPPTARSRSGRGEGRGEPATAVPTRLTRAGVYARCWPAWPPATTWRSWGVLRPRSARALAAPGLVLLAGGAGRGGTAGSGSPGPSCWPGARPAGPGLTCSTASITSCPWRPPAPGGHRPRPDLSPTRVARGRRDPLVPGGPCAGRGRRRGCCACP